MIKTQLPCNWVGGNDYAACTVCCEEYDWRKVPRPPCGARARIAALEAEVARLGAELLESQSALADRLRELDEALATSFAQRSQIPLTVGDLRRARALVEGRGT